MYTTQQELAGTEAQSDPDSSPVPIDWAGVTGRPVMGESAVDKQRGRCRAYTARSGDAFEASARFHRFGRVVKDTGVAMGRAVRITLSGA